MTVSQETLAQLYLDSPPADVNDDTQAEFCDWILTEFQQLPVAVQADYTQRYDSAEAMFEDIAQSHLWVSTAAYESDVYPNIFCGFALQAVHDYDHYRTQTPFTLDGEIIAYQAMARRAPSLEIQKILYSEFVLKSAAHLHRGHRPAPKVVFA